LRADAGYFAGELARAALLAGVEFAIGARRIAPLCSRATTATARSAYSRRGRLRKIGTTRAKGFAGEVDGD
jgi:hypothetical protein